MPDDQNITDSTIIPESLALTVLLDENNKLYYYEGGWINAVANNKIFETNFSEGSGSGMVIRKKQKT